MEENSRTKPRQKVIGCSPSDYDTIVKLCKDHSLTQVQVVHGLLDNYFSLEEPEPVKEVKPEPVYVSTPVNVSSQNKPASLLSKFIGGN